MNQHISNKKAPTIGERWLSAALLGVLVLISVLVVAVQQQYDTGLWREQPQGEDKSPPVETVAVAVDGLEPFSALEQYNPETLSDKINGKAELYLAAGFKELESQRFRLVSDTSQWMERYVYHMAGHRNAFAVFSTQRRSDVEGLDGHAHAYVAANGLFMVHGPYYVEIISAQDSDVLRAKAKALAQSFIAAHEVTSPPLVELAMFTESGQAASSLSLNAARTFGIEGFDWVYTAHYAESGNEAVAFITTRATAEAAASLADRFIAQWREYGGEAVPLPEAWAGASAVAILDSYEIVWPYDRYLVGVHEATELDFGLELIRRFHRAVKESGHGP